MLEALGLTSQHRKKKRKIISFGQFPPFQLMLLENSLNVCGPLHGAKLLSKFPGSSLPTDPSTSNILVIWAEI
jgi:hypothetical protein